jgi:hypothetical protein
MLKKIIRWVAIVLVAGLLLIQLYPKPARNISDSVSANDISFKYATSPEVRNILKTSCNDCHSNNTVYPWYADYQPVALWLNSHIQDGRRSLNFSEFARSRIARQYDKMEELEKLVSQNKMPLSSYTLIHTYAKLNSTQKDSLINWSRAIRDSLKARYPADSLILPKKKR